jgi:hypothetical protein
MPALRVRRPIWNVTGEIADDDRAALSAAGRRTQQRPVLVSLRIAALLRIKG